MKDLQVFFGGMKKGDWDVGIVMDIMKLYNNLDVIVLASGDGDYVPLIEYLRNHGQFVEVIAFGESASSKIKEQADEFIDLSKNKRDYLIPSKSKKWNCWLAQQFHPDYKSRDLEKLSKTNWYLIIKESDWLADRLNFLRMQK